METQEQILKEQRLKIETLRYRILLRYYELLLTLDVMTQPNEVKTLMGYINTLERYAKKYETKPVKKKSGKRKEHIDEIPVTDENTGSEETDYMPDNPFRPVGGQRRDIPSRSRCVAHRHRRLFKSRLCPLSETKRK